MGSMKSVIGKSFVEFPKAFWANFWAYLTEPYLLACHGQQKPSKLDILKIKDLKTTNRDRKKDMGTVNNLTRLLSVKNWSWRAF